MPIVESFKDELVEDFDKVQLFKPHKKICTIRFNNLPINALSIKTMECFEQALEFVQKDRDCRLLVLHYHSAGADLNEILELSNFRDAKKYSAFGQGILAKLERLPMPKVALIEKYALGGAYETALCCDRIITVSPMNKDGKWVPVKIGLPETKLGIIPGWGGTVRLPEFLDNKLRAAELIAKGETQGKIWIGEFYNELFHIENNEESRPDGLSVGYIRAIKKYYEMGALDWGYAPLSSYALIMRRGKNVLFPSADRAELFEAERKIFASLVITDEAKEKIKAALEKGKKKGGK